MQQRLTILGLGVSDLVIATDFYTKTLGWEKHSSSNDNITFIKLNGILLSLYPRELLAEDAGVSHIGSGFKAFTMAHNVNSKEEVNQIFSSLEEKGVTIIKHPEEVFWGGYSGYISDPDDNLWEIAFNPFLSLDAEGNVSSN